MKILEIRQANFNKAKYITSEIEIIRALNKIVESAHLFGIGDNKKNILSYVTLFKAPFGKASLFQLKMLFYLPYYIIKNKIDKVIFDEMSVVSSLILLTLRSILNLSVFLDVRTIPVENASNYKIYRVKKSIQFAGKFFDGASFITNGIKEFVENEYKANFKKTVTWSSGANIDIFNPQKSNQIKDEKLFKKIQGKYIIFYHGLISENRGINLILESIYRIKDILPEILFVSLSSNNKYIKEYCNRNNLDLNANLLLMDVVDNYEVPSYIQLADVCIVPLPRIEWWEMSSPLKLMEYLAMEKPVILSDIKAHLDVIQKNSDFCIYFDPDKKKSLDSKIIESHRKLDNLKKNAFKGRELIKKSYTWEHQAKNFLKLFI